MSVRVLLADDNAINREIIGPDIWGSGEPPAYAWVPPGTANYEGVTPYMPEWASQPYDARVAEAKAIMEAAGYTADKPLTLQIRYNTNDNHQRLAVFAKHDVAGLEITVQHAATMRISDGIADVDKPAQ